MFPSEFETEHLQFEQLCRRNISPREYYQVCSEDRSTIDDETRYLPWDPVKTIGEAASRLKKFETLWEDGERAEWLIKPKAETTRGELIVGTTGVICRWEQDLAIPAIWLRKSYWGNGYSGERADALLKIIFDSLDIDMTAILLHSENRKSYRAVGKYVERHGGRYEGVLRNHGGRYDEPIDHHRFTISQGEYRRTNGTETTVSIC